MPKKHTDKIKSTKKDVVKSNKGVIKSSGKAKGDERPLFSLDFQTNIEKWIEIVDKGERDKEGNVVDNKYGYRDYVDHVLKFGRGGSLTFTKDFDSAKIFEIFKQQRLEDLATILNDEMYKQLVGDEGIAGYTNEQVAKHLKVICEDGKLSLLINKDLQQFPDVKELQEKMNQYFDVMNPQIIDAVFSDKVAVHQDKDAQMMEYNTRMVMQAAIVVLVVALILAAIITALYFAAPAICTALGIGSAATVTTATSAATATVVTGVTAVAKEVRDHSKLKLLMDHAWDGGKAWVKSDSGKEAIGGFAKENILPGVKQGAHEAAKGVVGRAAKLASKYMLSFDRISDYDKVVSAQAQYDKNHKATADMMKKYLANPDAETLKHFSKVLKIINFRGRFDKNNPIHANLEKIVKAGKEGATIEKELRMMKFRGEYDAQNPQHVALDARVQNVLKDSTNLDQNTKDAITKELDNYLKQQDALKAAGEQLKKDVAKGVSDILGQVSAKVKETDPTVRAEKVDATTEFLKIACAGIPLPDKAVGEFNNIAKDFASEILKWHKLPDGVQKKKAYDSLMEEYLEGDGNSIAENFMNAVAVLEAAASKGKELAGTGVHP